MNLLLKLDFQDGFVNVPTNAVSAQGCLAQHISVDCKVFSKLGTLQMVEKQASGCAWIKLSTFNGKKSGTNIQSTLLLPAPAAGCTWETQPAVSQPT